VGIFGRVFFGPAEKNRAFRSNLFCGFAAKKDFRCNPSRGPSNRPAAFISDRTVFGPLALLPGGVKMLRPCRQKTLTNKTPPATQNMLAAPERNILGGTAKGGSPAGNLFTGVLTVITKRAMFSGVRS
jgi:hypothetical protein